MEFVIRVERWDMVVRELEFHGLKCVGKKTHDILFNLATPQALEQAAMLERFAGECELLGGLHHPCIVQFLGMCLEQGSPLPVLVMEFLHRCPPVWRGMVSSPRRSAMEYCVM